MPLPANPSLSLGSMVALLCSIGHRYLVLRGHIKRRELLLERILVLYDQILAIEAASQTRNLWYGGMDETTAKRAMEAISPLKMAAAA